MEKISKRQLERLPLYLKYLYSLDDTQIDNVSAPMIASALGLSTEQVRKDIQVISSVSGVPNRGREIKKLIADIERVLGFNNTNNAVIVGCGHLGLALLKYDGFNDYGIEIVGGFDNDPNVIGKEFGNKKIYDIHRMLGKIKELNALIGIVTVPNEVAQKITDNLISCGVEAIWNFSGVKLKVPSNIIVSDVNMAISLSELSHKLYMQKIKENNNGKWNLPKRSTRRN